MAHAIAYDLQRWIVNLIHNKKRLIFSEVTLIYALDCRPNTVLRWLSTLRKSDIESMELLKSDVIDFIELVRFDFCFLDDFFLRELVECSLDPVVLRDENELLFFSLPATSLGCTFCSVFIAVSLLLLGAWEEISLLSVISVPPRPAKCWRASCKIFNAARKMREYGYLI